MCRPIPIHLLPLAVNTFHQGPESQGIHPLVPGDVERRAFQIVTLRQMIGVWPPTAAAEERNGVTS